MTVTVPVGFVAQGVRAGLKSGDALDLAVVINEGDDPVGAAVYTSNRAKANPILWSQAAVKDGMIRAIVLNSGGANCFTGNFGFETARLTAATAGSILGCPDTHVQVCSTGLIGEGKEAFRSAILEALPDALTSASAEGGSAAAEAILTTDTHSKTAFWIGDGWSIGGMAKGAGMLAPGLATMLVVLTTDVRLTPEEAAHALAEATSVTFDRLDSDGCMSTNDQVTLMSSAMAKNKPSPTEFSEALTTVCKDLALQLLSDAEGASHDIAIEVLRATNLEDALEVGRSVARNNLFKAAIFGNDPNWGRVLAAIGTTKAAFDPYRVDVSMNGVRVCSNGEPDRPREEVDLTPRATNVTIDLKSGDTSATIWTNDLTHDYVHENSAYSS